MGKSKQITSRARLAAILRLLQSWEETYFLREEWRRDSDAAPGRSDSGDFSSDRYGDRSHCIDGIGI
jgi:hypothetical protein